MAVTDRLLPRRVPADLSDREVDFGQALATLGNHERSPYGGEFSRACIGFIIASTDR
jgi:hypothetical protein